MIIRIKSSMNEQKINIKGERMNKEQAKAWLPLIQAVADGKTIQSGCFDYFGGVVVKQTWADSHLPLQLEGIDPKYFRIKPEPKKAWYRIALHRSGTIVTLGEGDDEQAWQSKPNFVRWLTDRIEYELPEGEA